MARGMHAREASQPACRQASMPLRYQYREVARLWDCLTALGDSKLADRRGWSGSAEVVTPRFGSSIPV